MNDILLFMSDQHSPLFSSYMGGLAKSPTMEAMAENGISFDAAYTPCPLCVPARMAMLSGRLPSKTGILTNANTLPSTTPTFVHALAAAGYETVLVGRMHFTGEDQRHGFQHRLVGDITNVTWKADVERLREKRGVHVAGFGEPGATKVVGGGTSPVLEYDRAVVAAALEWLSRPHEKPQFILVGTYGPHFPYVASPEKYRYYKERVRLPAWFDEVPDYLDPAQRIRAERATEDPEVALRAMAAYCGMMEEIDEHLGAVRNAFAGWCNKNQREGTLLYTSDHGDQCGERRLFGKMSFFENSARVPLLMEGAGIPKGIRRNHPASLLDIGPTLCGMANVEPPPCQDGDDLLLSPQKTLNERAVVSEVYGVFGMGKHLPELDDVNTLSRMVRKGRYKYITRHKFEAWDMLFDLEKDPGETQNLCQAMPEIVGQMEQALLGLPGPDVVKAEQDARWKMYELLCATEEASEALKAEFWDDFSSEAGRMPEIV